VSSKKETVLAYTVMTLMALIFILPLAWIAIASLDTQASVAIRVPEQFSLANYQAVLGSTKNQHSFLVGLILSLGQSILVVTLAGLAAYPLSRYELRHKKLFMYTILFMTSLPITTLMVPVYKLFLSIHLYDNIFGVVLFMTSASLPYAIWMMKNFMDSVPVELEEAAWVDGATTMQSILRIVSPLMLPGICAVGIFTFTGSWGNFFVPFILLQTTDKYPASVTLYQYFGRHTVSYGQLAAYSLLYSFPSIILYMLSQRFMSKGFSMQGAAKG
jgi:multiple sugar transport system permease protein